MLGVGFDSGKGLLIFFFLFFFFLVKTYSSPPPTRHGNPQAHKFMLLPRYA